MKRWSPIANGSEGTVVYRSKKSEVTSPPPSAMFIRRAVSTFTLGPLVLWLIYLGGWYYFVPVVLILTLATVEYVRLLGALGWQLPLWLLLPVVLALLVASQWLEAAYLGPLLAAGLLLATIYALTLYEQPENKLVPSSWMGLLGGIVLLGWIGGHFLRLREVNSMAAEWTILTMLGTWIADSAAYVFGTRMGRHKLAPRLSPNKTIEGYVAGVIFGGLLTLLLGIFMRLPWPPALLVGLLVSGISPAGDLAISLLKREAGVKDSGHMLPGHGGALDRVDSLLWSVTMAYYVVYFLA